MLDIINSVPHYREMFSCLLYTSLTQLFEILNGERSKFEIPNLSNAEQQSLDQIEVILEDNNVIKIC